MTPQIKSHPIISKLIDAFGNWRKHRQEIRDLYDDEFSTLANELRNTPRRTRYIRSPRLACRR